MLTILITVYVLGFICMLAACASAYKHIDGITAVKITIMWPVVLLWYGFTLLFGEK